MNDLEKVDEFLLRKILGAPSKTPIEYLYLETATIPIEFILKSRRVNYLYSILTRNESELINRVYKAQKRRPIKDDWYVTVQQDLKDLSIDLTEEQIKSMSKQKYYDLKKVPINRNVVLS